MFRRLGALAATLALLATGGVAAQQEGAAAEAPRGEGGSPAAEAGGAAQLRELERAVAALQARLDDAKSRTAELAGRALDGAPTAARPLRIVHDDQMSSSYRLVRATYELDGVRIFDQNLEAREVGAFDVYVGATVPGTHRLAVRLEYRGEGTGLFSYLRGYRFRVRSTHEIRVAEDGAPVTVDVVAHERGGPGTPLEERPAIRFDVER